MRREEWKEEALSTVSHSGGLEGSLLVLQRHCVKPAGMKTLCNTHC